MCQLSLPNIVFEQMENLRHRKGKGLRRVREWWQGKGRKARVLQTYSSSHKALSARGPQTHETSILITALGQKTRWGAACLPGKGFGLFLAKCTLGALTTQQAHLFSLPKPFFILTSLGQPSLSEYLTPTKFSHLSQGRL